MRYPTLLSRLPNRARISKGCASHRGRLLSPAIITALIALVGALVIGIAPRPSQSAKAQAGSGAETLPSLFVLDVDDSAVNGYNVNGDYIRAEPFDETIPFHPTALKVDYVKGGNDGGVADASVIAADAASGFVFVSDEIVPLTVRGILFDIDFDSGDRLFTANLSRSNDGCDSKLFPDCALDEIVVANRSIFGAFTTVAVFQLQSNDSSHELIESFVFPGASPEDIAIGDIVDTDALETDDWSRFGRDGLAEIIVADPDTGFADIYDNTGSEVDTFFFDLNVESGDHIVTGNVNGVGGEDILVAHPSSGTIDVFDASFGAGGLIKAHLYTLNANFGPTDKLDLADIDGNGTDEILIAQADSNGVAVLRYDIVTQTIVADASLSIPYNASVVFTALPIRYPDSDGDGLFNHWETDGVDVDGDGTVDVDLPSMGADPNHKDLFVEYDYVEAFGNVDGQDPTRSAIQLVKDAFAVAPGYAGGVGNPDGEPGINVWVDTGDLTENGVLVGDNLGGGGTISSSDVPAEGMCGLGTDFQAIKEKYFDPLRTFVFRYALSVANTDGCDKGGQGEVGGNDFVEFIDDSDEKYDVFDEAQTFMHELGHNLSLLHGGFEDANCKPNYISVMNYYYTSGIYRQDGSTIIDFSPARVTTERANTPLPELVESALDETLVLDPSDNMNFVAFSGPSGVQINRPANAPIDWNQANGIEEDLVAANINNSQVFESCINSVIQDEPFKGHNDWANIILRVRNNDSSAAGAVVPPPFEEPSVEEILALKQALNTADLTISQVADPDPVVAGRELTYRLTITNNGPNPVNDIQVVDNLPGGVTYQESSADCSAADSKVTCNLPIVMVGEPLQVAITVLIDGELGLNEPGPAFITNIATVRDPAEVAIDPDPANNTSTLETEVEIQSDMELVSFVPASTPVELVVGEPALVGFETTVVNHGPFGPVTAVFDVVEPNAGPIIAGASSVVRADDLAAGEERTLSGTVILTCSEPGIHDVAIVNTVGLREAEVVDPDLSNNQAAAELSVECLVPVAINIKPGSETNPVNLNSQVPVALLTTTAGQYGIPIDIHATLIDPASIQFGARDVLLGVADPQGAAPRHSGGHFEDALELDERTRDGDRDLILHFKAAESGLAAGDVEACLRATITLNRTDTMEVFGCDAVTIRP